MTYLDLIELDRIAYQMAALHGTPLPEVTPSPRLRRLMDWVEDRYGVKVLARPHTFQRGSLGMSAAEEGIVTVYVHPKFPEEESVRILAHEAGHEEQRARGLEFDRSTIEGYVECEDSADELGYEIGTEWGEGALFDDDYRRERSELHGDLYAALDGLAHLSGIRNAFALTAIAYPLIYFDDPNLSADLRVRLGKGEREVLRWKELASLCFEHPEWLVGFDRRALLSGWSITRVTSEEENRLEVANPAEAAQLLYHLLQSRVGAQPRYAKLIQHDGRPTHFIHYADDYTAGAFIQAVQEALLSGQGHSARLVWEVSRTPAQAIYALNIRWGEDADLPDYRLFYTLDGYQLHQERGSRNDEAVRYFINTFRHEFAILERTPAEMWSGLLYLLLDDRPDARIASRANGRPAKEEEGQRSAQAAFMRTMQSLLEAARALAIEDNPDPEALFDPSASAIQIWCTPDDHPQGWGSIPMEQGAFSKPCAYVGVLWWSSQEGVIRLETEATELVRAGIALSETRNRPGDVYWAMGKVLDLFYRAGVAEPPPIVIQPRQTA